MNNVLANIHFIRFSPNNNINKAIKIGVAA